MSLQTFIDHPFAKELLHNGQAYQVLGITNQSYWDFAAGMRDCLQHDSRLQTKAAEVAADSLRRYRHVGIFNRLEESLASLAAALAIDIARPPSAAAPAPPLHQNASEEPHATPPQSLAQSYHSCNARSRRKNAARRASALRALGFHDNSRLTFSAATRARIPAAVIARIRELNQMDTVLYTEGQRLLSERIEAQRRAGTFKLLPPAPTENQPGPPEQRVKDEL